MLRKKGVSTVLRSDPSEFFQTKLQTVVKNVKTNFCSWFSFSFRSKHQTHLKDFKQKRLIKFCNYTEISIPHISPYLFGGMVTCWKLFMKTTFYFCITILSWHFSFFLFCRLSWMSSKRPSLASLTHLNHHSVAKNCVWNIAIRSKLCCISPYLFGGDGDLLKAFHQNHILFLHHDFELTFYLFLVR